MLARATRGCSVAAWQGGSVKFETDRSYQLGVSPDALWTALVRVEDYQQWWPWLRRFDADHLGVDAVWRCLVQPPLPYRVRFAIRLVEVQAPTTIRASITGDVVGDAHLEISEVPGGCDARLVARLEPDNGFLKAVARIAAPAIRYGHDWVLDAGARQFLERAV